MDELMNKQLSPLRRSVLNWYEFKKEASMLVIGSVDQEIIGLFKERCKKVNVVEMVSELSLREHYDYIVALDVIETISDPAEAIKEWMCYLKPEGTLLLSAENRYGIKYFCGARDPHTSLPFDGINGYIRGDGGNGRCLSRQEVLSAIENATVAKYKFYYPVPDSRMPQMIFTDEYMKGLNTAERLVDYNYADDTMIGIEHRMFCDMINSGALPFMANSFLLELKNEGELADIIYAVTTTDRGMNRGMATTIRNTGIVKKRPLWPQGEENIRKIHDYTMDLASHGVPIVETELEEDEYGLALCMPYIDAEGLSSVMKRLVLDDPEEFIRVFDEIYRYIVMASEMIELPEDNGQKVLKRAYIDLAPCNCFYIRETDSLLFYDQEFMMEDCPAQFAMFRTLKYCYASARDMDRFVPLKDMYERYGIDMNHLEMFENKEEKFIQSVRHIDEYASIFKVATPDYDKIYERMEKLSAVSTQEVAEVSNKPYHIGYVPGVFDLFHTGHLILLERCKERCDYLIVGVLTDELVEYYKGHRTVISYEDRARVIEALSVVDKVIPVDFSNTDKLDAWEQLHYDCHFSGDDHVNHWNDVWEELKKRGSNMEFFSYTQGISSTQIRNRIK